MRRNRTRMCYIAYINETLRNELMFKYVDLREPSENTKKKEMACLSELSHVMDQFVDLATKTYSYLCKPSEPKQSWNMFKLPQTNVKIGSKPHTLCHS